MGGIYEEFQRDLDLWRERYADRPRDEMIRLFLLALEREEIVAVSYRESRIAEHLAAMPLDDDVRDLIRQALVWVWKDEEMHAIYIRGAILKLGRPALKAQAFATQFAGAVGGWSAAVRQHVGWRDAPLSRTAATLATKAGVMLGKVPRSVAPLLDNGAFRDFCLFNVDAERTAWLCWDRLVRLAETVPGMPESLIADFRRIEIDEENHRRIFQILADVLTDEDRLAPGVTAADLAARIAEVGEFFLPRELRAGQDNPIGKGGDVFVFRSEKATPDRDEKRMAFRKILDESGLPRVIEQRSRQRGVPVERLRVAVKTSFMMGYDRRDTSVICDPELLNELVLWLRERGCADVAVVEARNLYEQWFSNRSVENVADYFGIDSTAWKLVDLSSEQAPHHFERGIGQYSIGQTWRDAELRISFAKLRAHPSEGAFATYANLESIGGRCDLFFFTERQAHHNTAVAMVQSEFPCHFAVLDAWENLPDGILGVIGCPRPKAPRRFYAGEDLLAVDLTVLKHIGIRPDSSSIVKAGCHWFDDPSERIRVVGCDEPIGNWRGPYENDLTTLLSFLAYPVYEYWSGRGSFFVPEMDPVAFPPAKRVGVFTRVVRRVLQRFLGVALRN